MARRASPRPRRTGRPYPHGHSDAGRGRLRGHQQIKANPALKTIPVIVVTSYALSGDEDKARAAGCDDYITKPYSPRQLLAKIKEHLH